MSQSLELDEQNRRLLYRIDDQKELNRLTSIFEGTGEVKWAWTRFGEGEWMEHRAEPKTGPWFSDPWRPARHG